MIKIEPLFIDEGNLNEGYFTQRDMEALNEEYTWLEYKLNNINELVNIAIYLEKAQVQLQKAPYLCKLTGQEDKLEEKINQIGRYVRYLEYQLEEIVERKEYIANQMTLIKAALLLSDNMTLTLRH